MIVDIFGTEIQIGHVIAISKGTRGHRDLEVGIVTEIQKTPSQAWIHTSEAKQEYDWNTRSLKSDYHLVSRKHLVSLKREENGHVVVIQDIAGRPVIHSKLLCAAKLLIKNQKFPENYVLGVGLVSSKEAESKKTSQKVLEELSIFLDAPKSLKKTED